jgi:hypothetical protein
MQALFSSIGKVFSNWVVYALAYIVLMLPTYFLPYAGSNSAVIAGLGAAAGVGLSPQFWMHVACLYLLIVITWLRGCVISKQWIAIFPLIATVFDMVPGVNLIPLIPTVMHICALVFGSRGGAANTASANVPVSGGIVALIGTAAVSVGLVQGFTWQARVAQKPIFAPASPQSEVVTRTPAPPKAAAANTDAQKADHAALPKQASKTNIDGDWFGFGVRLKIVGGNANDALKAKAWLSTEKEPSTFLEVFPRQIRNVRQYADKTNSFVIEVKATDFVDAQFKFPPGEGGEIFLERFWRFQDPMNVNPLPGVGVPTGVASLDKK